MFKKLLSLTLVFLIVFSFCSCGGNKGADAQLVYPIDRDPGYLDPQIIYDIGAKNIIANCFEGLTGIDAEGKIVPAAAEKWETNAKGTRYTFYLRKDMKWKVTAAAGKIIGENYKEEFDFRVTAHDFAFGLTRALLPETLCPGADSLFSIKNAKKVYNGNAKPSSLGIKVIDDYTLQITLSQADPDFLYTLLESYCMPCNKEFFEKTGGRYGLATRYLIYNGPFYINNWADNSSISVRKSDAYHSADSVMPASVYYSMNNEQPTRLKKLTDSTYSVTPLSAEQAASLSGKKSYTVNAFSSSVTSLVFNCGYEDLKNENIRKGIVAALDYSVIKNAMGECDAAGLIPDSFRTGSVSFSEYRKETDRYFNASPLSVFKKGLNEAEKTNISVTVLCTPENENTVRTLMQSWQSVLGVAFTVYAEATDEVTLKQRVKKGDFQLALTDLDFTGNRAYSVLSSFTTRSKENFTSFKDKEYNALVAEMKAASNSSDSAAAAKKAEQYLISSCVAVPLYKGTDYYGLGKKVSGVIHNVSGEIIYFKNTVKK
ncbi:MAG: peptide ABC transporter substrate-binding protein [Clostridia bacterium]|nr:peptide ABC transporter substrate-binding protein [Clostridia bacterium]